MITTEFEIKFLDIDTDLLKKRLDFLGAKIVFDRRMCNTIFFGITKSNFEYIRIRDDGQNVTITYKKIHPDNISTTEVELNVESYLDTVQFFEKIGFIQKRKDEKHRIRYSLDNVFIDFDTWPNIPTYIEIEGKSKRDIQGVCKKLGVTYKNRFMGDTLDVFRFYGIDPEIVTVLSFNRKNN